MSKELEEFREFIDFMYESIDIEDHQRFVAISESMLKDGWFKWIYRYAKEQAERARVLESESYNAHLERMLDKREQQNKKYRDALEKLVKQETLGRDVKTNKTVVSFNGMVALKGLGEFDNKKHLVYGIDENVSEVKKELE